MNITTFIKGFPQFHGFHVYDADAKRFLSARRLREMRDDYCKVYWDGYEDQKPENWEQMTAEDKWEFFRDELLETGDFELISVPKHIGFGIFIPEIDDYINHMKRVMNWMRN